MTLVPPVRFSVKSPLILVKKTKIPILSPFSSSSSSSYSSLFPSPSSSSSSSSPSRSPLERVAKCIGREDCELAAGVYKGKSCGVGGAEVIKQMFETGELAKVLDGFLRRQPRFVCKACGDVRFMPCGNCSGSRKVFDEDEGVPKRCLECNENGLIRCPDCCS